MGGTQCPRCLQFEDEVRELRQRLAASGQPVTPAADPNTTPNRERELQRWLAGHPHADGSAGFRAGWARLSLAVSDEVAARGAERLANAFAAVTA